MSELKSISTQRNIMTSFNPAISNSDLYATIPSLNLVTTNISQPQTSPPVNRIDAPQPTATARIFEENIPNNPIVVSSPLRHSLANTPTLNLPEGAYEGQVRDGKRHGYGTMVYRDGSRYTGNWVEGKRHGLGIMVYNDGSIYGGDWIDDKRHGKGIIISRNNESYSGTWVNDKKEGQGISIEFGRTYEGSWMNDVWHGRGVLVNAIFPNGLAGIWVHGRYMNSDSQLLRSSL